MGQLAASFWLLGKLIGLRRLAHSSAAFHAVGETAFLVVSS